MIYKIFFVFIVLFIASCSAQEHLQKLMNYSYENFKKEIPEKLFSNFPKEILGRNTYLHIEYPEGLKHNQNHCGVFIKYNLSDSLFDVEYLKHIKNAAYVGSIKENQMLELKAAKIEDGITNHLNVQYKDSLYIVPDYRDRFNPLKEDSLSDNVKTVIIESQLGKFLPEKYYEDENSLPENCKHGFSKGIYFDTKKKKMIYWLIIW